LFTCKTYVSQFWTENTNFAADFPKVTLERLTTVANNNNDTYLGDLVIASAFYMNMDSLVVIQCNYI